MQMSFIKSYKPCAQQMDMRLCCLFNPLSCFPLLIHMLQLKVIYCQKFKLKFSISYNLNEFIF